ncbi:MAG: hypothetical protein BWX47_02146 [candidate division Hyd24-12 bacterium ADurb.Bin004]|nr:MAG: hypothetical protein BWX47_02146 [candidate division Hyd24-12 bacterium ADurb.Bin004]
MYSLSMARCCLAPSPRATTSARLLEKARNTATKKVHNTSQGEMVISNPASDTISTPASARRTNPIAIRRQSSIGTCLSLKEYRSCMMK